MSRDAEAGTQPPGPRRRGAGPWLSAALLVLALSLAAWAGPPGWGIGLQVLALLLLSATALLAGGLWALHRQADHLRKAHVTLQMLSQMSEAWHWQTDAQHRLLRWQPPQAAPASAWVAGASQDQALWHRLDDASSSLQARMQAQVPLTDLRVQQTPRPGATGAARPALPTWRLRALPRFDGRGQFEGYLGLAWPTDLQDTLQQGREGLDALLAHGSSPLCLATPSAEAEGWTLTRANPAALALMALPALPDGGLPWAEALASLPGELPGLAAALSPGQDLSTATWHLRLDALAGTGAETRSALLLSLSAVTTAGPGLAEATRQAASQAAAEEQAAFSYTISHDLRAPIRVIEGFGRILKEDYATALDRMGRDHLDRVMAAAARMNHMIDALLSLSRLSTQPLAQQPVNLSQLAAWVVDDLQRMSPERSVVCTIEPGLMVQGDPTLLRLVLENLLGNAWKYSARATTAQISLTSTLQGDRRVYQVRDNGAGFDMRFADRLFGVFQRLHSSSDYPGHGVGLASVQRIVRRHGGEIWAEGEVGSGATFSFTLGA